MADFAEGISDERAGRRLARAIDGKGAFRRFKDELHEEYPHLLPAWYAFRDVRAKRRAVDWLVDKLPHRRRGSQPLPDRPAPGRQGLLQQGHPCAPCVTAALRQPFPNPQTNKPTAPAAGRRGGRPPTFNPERYKQRNTAERCVNKLKMHRPPATRYDKREYMYQGTIDVACIRIWLSDPRPMIYRTRPKTTGGGGANPSMRITRAADAYALGG
jgi:hypothetical protein